MSINERFIRITCSEGRTQSLQRLGARENADRVFRQYKSRVRSVRETYNGSNPGLTDEWIAGLKYEVEVENWVYNYSNQWSENGWRLISVSTHDNIDHNYYEFKYDNGRGISIGAISLEQGINRLQNLKGLQELEK